MEIVLISSVAGSRHDFVLSGHGQRLHLLPAQLRRDRRWYHKMLKDRPDDVNAFIEEARKFANRRFISRDE